MAFLGDNELIQEIETKGGKWVHPFEQKHLKSAAYELGLGGEAFMTDSKDGKPEILNADNPTIEINPGQFALLITSEKVNIPKDKIAFISIKAGVKFKGLVNVSGFHVDPGFSGRLLFSVYNAGSAKITLRKEDRYFLIWFSELKTPLEQDEVYNENENHHQGQEHIRTEYIDNLKSGELASPNALAGRIVENKNLLERLFWAAGILIGLAIATTIGIWSKKSDYEAGYNFRMKEESLSKTIDSLTRRKVDSILAQRFPKYDTLRSK